MSSQLAITAATAAGRIQIADVKPDGGAAKSGNVKPCDILAESPSTPRSAGSAADPPRTPSTQPRVSAPPSHLTSKDFKPPSPKSQSTESVCGGGAAMSTKKDFKAEDLRDSSASSKWVQEHYGNQKLMELSPGEFLKFDDERKEWVKIGEQEYRESFKVGRHKADLQTAAMLLNKMRGPTPGDRYIKGLMEVLNEGGTNIRQGTSAQNMTGTAAQKAANQEKGDRTAEMKFHRIMDGSLPDEDVKWTDNDSAKLQQYRNFLEQTKDDPNMTEAYHRVWCDWVKRLERIEKMSASSKALTAAASDAAAAKVVAEAKIAHDAKVKAEAEATKAKALATAAAEAKAKADAKAKAVSDAAAAKAVADAKIAHDAKVKAEAEATKAKDKALAEAKAVRELQKRAIRDQQARAAREEQERALSDARARAASARYVPTYTSYTSVSHSNYTRSSPTCIFSLFGSANREDGSSSGGDCWGDSSDGYGGGSSSSSDHRCLDGSRDMRFSDNWGFDKYS